ncbi:MAG: DUF3016 domain-containing protein [Telluria sp.]
MLQTRHPAPGSKFNQQGGSDFNQRQHSGEAQLQDTAFLDRPNRYFNHDVLRYEKRMVDTWFDKTILSGAPAAGR